jgi:hypothetical protein
MPRPSSTKDPIPTTTPKVDEDMSVPVAGAVAVLAVGMVVGMGEGTLVGAGEGLFVGVAVAIGTVATTTAGLTVKV